jgi:DNA-binding MarR family transcriptional regulator
MFDVPNLVGEIMMATVERSRPAAGRPDIELAGQLGAAVSRLLRVVTRARAAVNDGADPMDVGTFPLLVALGDGGSMRSVDLASAVFSDPSTVSRQVAQLVGLGYVERSPDPTDRRAFSLALTDSGRAALERRQQTRDAHLAQITMSWSGSDRRRLAELVDRLATDLANDMHHRCQSSGSRLLRHSQESA